MQVPWGMREDLYSQKSSLSMWGKREKGENHILHVSEGGMGLAFIKALLLPQLRSCLQGLLILIPHKP